MKNTIVSLASLGLLALLIAVPQAIATQAGAQQDMVFEGQLVRVDSNSQTLIAQDSQGEATLFYYTDDTEVSGAVQDVQGLTGRTGAQLRVTYRTQNEMNIATQIEISAPPER